ncbi:YopX family protein [Blastomonas sp. SL216]|uniref:YopX family protein n=1 Tax=Blastomonas sp. SL216 TaxID=2995169 RepID=UPI002377D1FB|nr:YopX family protein [Blastomonas sp. SL216]
MNYEIKFRAWVGKMEYDIVTGKFGTFFVNSGKRGDGLDDNDSATLTPFNTKLPDDTPLMQFTGLKDKNGKDIWSGDIVRCADLGPIDMPLIQRTGYVEYEPNNGTFGVWVDWTEFGTSNDGEARALWPMGHYRLSEFEVIGNIHENPDLLA